MPHNSTRSAPLHYATSYSQPAAVALLLAKGAEVEARDALDRTPLMYAAIYGDVEAVRALLAAGARWDSGDQAGENAEDHAHMNLRADCATLLKEDRRAHWEAAGLPPQEPPRKESSYY